MKRTSFRQAGFGREDPADRRAPRAAPTGSASSTAPSAPRRRERPHRTCSPRFPGQAAGHVTFVGAGPGDAELLTLEAMRALRAADVILFDDLVSDEVLELARREAKRIPVGKRAGRPSCRQNQINERMVRLARAGRRVVRLKSGDPMVFGRAGEEIAELEAAGIGYDVVPASPPAWPWPPRSASVPIP